MDQTAASQAEGSQISGPTIPKGLVLVIALLLVSIPIVRLFDIESGIKTLISAGAVLLSFLVFVFWVCFLCSLKRTVRILIILLVLGGPVIFFWNFKVTGTSGALVPTFGWRNAPAPDELLDQPTRADLHTADLATTTSNDFPQFLGPNRNACVDDSVLATDWMSRSPRLAWKQKIGAGWSAFSAVNGFAVTMEQRGEIELVTCYEVSNGRLVWSHGIEARHETLPGGIGPRSTPTIHDGRVFALGATGVLQCLDGATGKPQWTVDLMELADITVDEDQGNVTWGRSASPLIVDAMVVVPLGGSESKGFHSMAAFHAETGDLIWKGGTEQVSYSSPALATISGVRQILIVNESSVSAHVPETGVMLWRHPWKGNSNADATGSQAVPVGTDRVWLSKGYGVGATLLQVNESSQGAWDVQPIWKRTVMKTKFTNVAFLNGFAYGLDDQILSCVEVESGRRVWKMGRYGHGQLLLVGSTLLITSEHGEVVLVNASPESKGKVVARFEALDGKMWNNPCLHGRFLLVRTAEDAACFELAGSESPSDMTDHSTSRSPLLVNGI